MTSREVLDTLAMAREIEGVADVAMTKDGGTRHPLKLVVQRLADGATKRFPVSLSAMSDRRSGLNFRAQIRRWARGQE